MVAPAYHANVLVVGAGPVGMLAAALLRQQGLNVEIVDEEWRAGTQSYALALHPHSLHLLAQLGLVEHVIKMGYRVDRLALYDGPTRAAEIKLSALPGEFPYVIVLRQDVLEHLLEQHLKKLNLPIGWRRRVSALLPQDDYVLSTIDELAKESAGYAMSTTEWVIDASRTMAFDYVIGADGYRSLVRRTLSIPYETVAPPEFFAIFEFNCTQDLQHEVRVVFHEDTVNVLWPLPGSKCRWSFQLRDVDFPPESHIKDRIAQKIGSEFYPLLNQGDLDTLLWTRAPWFSTAIGEITWAIAVRFERRLAREFGEGRCWLAGDAAHLTGPIGVQSMNVGLREAADLATAFSQILRYGASADILEQFNRDRVAEWRLLQGLEGELLPTENTPAVISRRLSQLLSCLPASADDLVHMAGQLGLQVSTPGPIPTHIHA